MKITFFFTEATWTEDRRGRTVYSSLGQCGCPNGHDSMVYVKGVVNPYRYVFACMCEFVGPAKTL